MSQHRQKSREQPPRKAIAEKVASVLSGIRVPDLPYPAGKLAPEQISDWRPLLLSCWAEQRQERVTHVIRSVHLDWSARQINAAYIADRIMDVFLKTSGLHPELAGRIARLRFYLAWRLNLEGDKAFSSTLLDWLDSLQEWRGWSASGGRSSRVLLDQLDALVIAVSGSFKAENTAPVDAFCRQWQEDADKRNAQVDKLRQRLLQTEQGAARQRRADQTAKAVIGRALQERRLPLPIIRFIFDHWQSLLKQAVWEAGTEGDTFRHGSKLLEWLVWIGDPDLSDQDRNRLYNVGEQIGDRILDVWHRTFNERLPAGAVAGIEAVLVSRLRGESPELLDALSGVSGFRWDSEWLDFDVPEPTSADGFSDHWFVEGEGASEQRRFFFALLPETAEVLWTNGAGVKLGLQPWHEFEAAFHQGSLRVLPEPTGFGQVLVETVELLARVCEKQRLQREQAAESARVRAEALRQEKQAEEQRRRAQEAAREAQREQQRQLAEQQRQADEQAELERIRREQTLVAQRQVDAIKLGGWIVVEAQPDRDASRLKLAVRINASRKLVFVDRLGLNRLEYLEDDLVQAIVAQQVRVLGSAAEFDDTLSRVVGRIRVGRP